MYETPTLQLHPKLSTHESRYTVVTPLYWTWSGSL